MTKGEEFTNRLMKYTKQFCTSEDDLFGFGKGFHLALACMFFHPEWGRAALSLLEESIPNTENVAQTFVNSIPIEIGD